MLDARPLVAKELLNYLQKRCIPLEIAGLLTVNAQEYSNRGAMRLIEGQTKDRNSFAVETNLADVDTWKFLTGYKIHIKFFSTDDIHILNERISERYRQGAHFVMPEVVMERYVNGLNLLNAGNFYRVGTTLLQERAQNSYLCQNYVSFM